MKNLLSVLFFVFSINAFSQIEPAVTYDGGDLYFVPSKLTSDGTAFMYSYKYDYESGRTWFTIFDDNVNVVTQSEIEAQVLNYTKRTVISQRRYFMPYNNGGTRASSGEEGYFLDEWTQVSDVTEAVSTYNEDILSPEVYEDNNNYHSRSMYLSQTLFDDDEDFEFMRRHYEIMPLSYCATDDKGDGVVSDMPNIIIGGEQCDYYTRDYDSASGGIVFTLFRQKVYGGVKHTGIDIVSLNGDVKKTLVGIKDLGTVVAINGNFYVSCYDVASNSYALYKIATATTSVVKVADLTSNTSCNITYNLDGLRVALNTKGIVIKNGQKIFQ